MKSLRIAILVSVSLFVTSGATLLQAGVVVYNSSSPSQNASVRQSWLTAIGIGAPQYLVDFEVGFEANQNVSGVTGLFPAGLVVTDTSAAGRAVVRTGAGVINGSSPIGSFALTQNEQPYLVLDFTSHPVDYFGFNDIDHTGTAGTLHFLGGGTANFSFEATGSGANIAEFVGVFRNDQPRIVSVQLDSSGDGMWGVDNIEYGGSATETFWQVPSGSWGDANGWTAGEPNPALRATITNGGTATISQTGRSCTVLTLGVSSGQSGSVSMVGGALSADTVYVGYGGAGTFTQTGGDHFVAQALSIAAEANSGGAYHLQGGTLWAGRIDVGGSSSGIGGTGLLAVSGGNAVLTDKLVVWSGGTVSLGLGTVVSADGNHPAFDLDNNGRVEVGDGNGVPVVYCLGTVTGNGDIVIGSGATLWVESLEQHSVWINAGGTLVLASQDPQLYAAMAQRNFALAVPEPGTLAMMILGGLLAVRRRGCMRRKGAKRGRRG